MRIIFVTLIAFLIHIINSQKRTKCGLNSKIIPKLIEEDPNENQYQFGRKLSNESEEYRDINIVLDYKNIETEIELNNLNKYKSLIINSMNKAVETLKNLVKIKTPISCFTLEVDFIEYVGFYFWDKERFGITNEKKKFSTCDFDNKIDLLIFTRFFNETEMNADNSSLMNALVLYSRASNSQPIVGGILFDKNTDYSLKNSDRLLDYIFIHTMTHILGFTNICLNYFNYSYIAYDIYGNLRRYINSTKVIKVAKKYFNCDTIKGIELEDYSGSSGVHWESRILLGEYMNSIYLEEQIISEFTLSFLDDLGYYKINYYTGGLMGYGKNKGCKFIQEKCVKNQKIDPYFENEFFESINSDNYIDPSCSSGRQSRTYFAFWIKSYIPYYYNYYGKDFGGFEKADYCPVSRTYYREETNGYYVGNCNFGFGDYGNKIMYSKDNEEVYYKSGDIEKITGEKYTDHSFCYQSSLVKTDDPDYNIFSKVVRSVCYETFCSSKSLTIKIHDNYIVCPRAGGKIKALGFEGFLLCPDYNLICSGTVLCNDFIDCVFKNSTLKNDSYIYDYTIKTSQNIEKAEEEVSDSTNNYELSDDGKCSKFCKQCTESFKCISCIDNFYLVGNKENESELSCINTNISYGYYKENSIYYKCSNNCQKCKNESYCIKCQDNYGLISNKTNDNEYLQCKKLNELIIGYYSINTSFIDYYETILLIKIPYYIYSLVYYECIKNCEICSNSFNCQKCRDKFVFNSNNNKCIIPNCEIYDSNENCDKCYENYALSGDEENNCVEKSVFLDSTYYTKDGGKTYYSCDGEGDNHIKNCNKCIYNENNIISLSCQECIYGYTLLEDKEINKCYGINGLKKNTYFSINETHMRNCSKEIKNCIECENKEKCIKCNNDFYLINIKEKNIFCADTNQIYPADEYYFDENSRIYYHCNKSIDNCKKCLDASLCTLCEDGYTFINGDKKKCNEIKNLGNNFYQDPKDPSNYESCSKFDKNCLYCSSYEKCTHCLEGYELNNETKCIEIINATISYERSSGSSSSSGLIIGIIIGGGVVLVASIITIIYCVRRKCKGNPGAGKDVKINNSENMIYINNMINCTFKTAEGKITSIPIRNDQTMSMLLFSYLDRIGQSGLFNKSKITFVYKENIIDYNCPVKVGDYLQTSDPTIYVYGEMQVIRGNDKIEVTFKTQIGLEKKITIGKNKSIGELIILFLNAIGRMDLFNRNDLLFLFNARKISNYTETVENLVASTHLQPIITVVGGQI